MSYVTTDVTDLLPSGSSAQWVRLLSGSQYYISRTQTDDIGTFVIHKVPNGTYTLGRSISPNGPWITEDSAYVVASNPATGTALSPVQGVVMDFGGAMFHAASPKSPNPVVMDAAWITDAAITSGQAVVTSPSNGLKDSSGNTLKAGAIVMVAGAGAAGVVLISTVLASPSPTTGSVTLAANAGTTVSGKNACFGTDNWQRYQQNINAQQTNKGLAMFLPPGSGLTSQILVPAPGTPGAWTSATVPLLIQGAGMQATAIVAANGGPDYTIFGYGNNGNPVIAQLELANLTLDGNYVGLGGAMEQRSANHASLIQTNWPFNQQSTNTQNGLFHHLFRVRFYRTTGYVTQSHCGIAIQACTFDQVGQPDLASGATHLDALGSSLGEGIVMGSSWKDSSGNYADFINNSPPIRMVFIGNLSRNHQIGGFFACGTGTIMMGNQLVNTVAGSGVGYDAGTGAGARSKNVVCFNVLTNLTVNASGLSPGTYGDIVAGNIASDSGVSGDFTIPGAGASLTIGSAASGISTLKLGDATMTKGTGQRWFMNSDFVVTSGFNLLVAGGGNGSLDSQGANNLQIGNNTATRVDIGKAGVDTSVLGNLRRAKQTPTEAVLVSGVDATQGSLIVVTLTAARLVGAPLNPAIGQRLTFTLIQGGAGAFAVTWNAVFKKTWADTGNATGARSTISYVYDGTNWNQDGAQAPYV